MDIDYKALIDNIFDGLYLVDKTRCIMFWNQVAEKITGYPAAEVIGRHCRDNLLVHVDRNGNSLCDSGCPLEATIRDGSLRDAEVFLRHRDGHRVPIWVRVAPLYDTSGTIIGGAELFTDLSTGNAISTRLNELEQLSFIDKLTQLANRRFIEIELERRIGEKQRYGTNFGVLFMDIDFFKRINDIYGHATGHRVLQTVARTMLSTARPSDLMGRWGGEEFIEILRQVDSDGLRMSADRMRALIGKSSFRSNGHDLQVTVSIGATLLGPTDTVESVIQRADGLLYKSKQAGRNCCHID